jgi:hypothetical protein
MRLDLDVVPAMRPVVREVESGPNFLRWLPAATRTRFDRRNLAFVLLARPEFGYEFHGPVAGVAGRDIENTYAERLSSE